MSKEILRMHEDKNGESSLFTLNVKNLHIHLDERSYINSSYSGTAGDEGDSKESEDDTFDTEKPFGRSGCCDCEDDNEGAGKCFDTEEVIKDVSAETGFSEDAVRKILNKQAELLMKRLFDED